MPEAIGRDAREAPWTKKDPVCGMLLDRDRAAATVHHEGRTYRFCSLACRDRFVREPQHFLDAPSSADLDR